MVRGQTWRRKKYEAKISGTVAERRIDAYDEYMKSLHSSITSILVEKETQAKEQILEPAGVGVAEIPFYLNSMREFCRICRNFTSVTRDNECYNILLKYRDKGLVLVLLYKLAALCGCYPIGYEYYV